MKISIIIPCYNEVGNVAKLYADLLPVVEGIVEHGWNNSTSEVHSAEMIFVDDGSQDNTLLTVKECFNQYQGSSVVFKYLRHDKNSGLGAAIRTGFENADGDILVTVDSDGTYKFSEIPAILCALTPAIDIVTASPYHPRGGVIGVPGYRLLFSRGSSLIYRLLVDRHIHTYTSLFRVYRAPVVKNIHFEANDFLGGTELLVKAVLKGYRVAEFPAILSKREVGVSKAKIAQTIISHLNFQMRIFLFRLQTLTGLKQGGTI